MKATGDFPSEVFSGERGYRYGERWLYRAIPQSVLEEIVSWSATPGPRESLHEAKAKQFLADHGLRLKAEPGDETAPWDYRGDHPHFRVVIIRERTKARLSFDFWAGVDTTKLTPYSVLSCISSDLGTPETFEEFRSDYGEDPDSRKALSTFKRCAKHADKLRAFFTEEEQEALKEIR